MLRFLIVIVAVLFGYLWIIRYLWGIQFGSDPCDITDTILEMNEEEKY